MPWSSWGLWNCISITISDSSVITLVGWIYGGLFVSSFVQFSDDADGCSIFYLNILLWSSLWMSFCLLCFVFFFCLLLNTFSSYDSIYELWWIITGHIFLIIKYSKAYAYSLQYKSRFYNYWNISKMIREPCNQGWIIWLATVN